MKYIIYIILIIILSSLLVGYNLLSRRQGREDIALSINGLNVTMNEFNRLSANRPPYLDDENDFINSLVTRKLLIREAKNLGLDKGENFRWSLQNFYEQSLIKALMDIKFDSLDVRIEEEEIDQYADLLQKSFLLTRFNFQNLAEANAMAAGEGEEIHIPFAELSFDMRPWLLGLQEGDTTEPVKTLSGYDVFRIDRIENMPDETPVSREEVGTMLREYKLEKEVNDWIAGLRDSADIKFTNITEPEVQK